MSTLRVGLRGRSGALVGALALALGWSAGAGAVPVLYVSVNGGSAVSYETEQVCDESGPTTCFGTGSNGDLLISSWELSSDPTYVTGAFNFYNSSLTQTLSVEATVLVPLIGAYATPTLGLGTGDINNVFGGGILNLTVEGLIDGSPVFAIAPGSPFSVCENLGADPSCQNAVTTLSDAAGSGPLASLATIGLRLSFDLSPDTTATIGLTGGEVFNGASYFSIVSGPVVPVPAAAWLFGSALALVGVVRRRR